MDFWQKGDRILALASGGAFLGVLMIGDIPGAIIGALLASIYACLVTK